jgi:hypothetical protein
VICTEDEAKTKWCPFTRISSGEREWHTNRPSHAEVHDKAFDRCIGSACMAWRFPSTVVDVTGWSEKQVEELRQKPAVGYCGLAGQT